MELISSKDFLILFRKIRNDLLFPLEYAAKHASFIMSFRASMTPEAFNDLYIQSTSRTNALFEALLADHISEESIRDIFERMTPEEAVFCDNRLRAVERFLLEHPEMSVRRDPTRGEMFWIDFLKGLLVIPCPAPF